MDIITQQNKANTTATRWMEKYFDSRKTKMWKNIIGPEDQWISSEVVFDKLVELGDEPTVKDVIEATGNSSWTDITCLECGCCVEAAVLFNSKTEFVFHVCHECLSTAMSLIGKEKKSVPRREDPESIQ